MPKKKVSKKAVVIVAEQLTGYLTCMDYAATGEGRTIELNFCYAVNEEEAKSRHLDKFYGDDEPARNYFGVGIEVMPIKSEKAKALIKDMFNHGEGTWKVLTEATTEFHYKLHFNYS